MHAVLVTGAGGPGSNNLIRGIRAANLPITIIGTNADRYQLGRSLADKNYLLPHAREGEKYFEAMKEVLDSERVDLLIPNNDSEVGYLSSLRVNIPAVLYLPSEEVIELCQDKFKLQSFLSKKGVPVPQVADIQNLDTLSNVFDGFPHNERLWCRLRKGAGSRGSLPVGSVSHAQFWIEYWRDMRGACPEDFMLCEYLPGRDFAFQSLWQNGTLVIAKTCERLIYLFGENMPSGTSSTPRVGRLVNEPEVNELCTRAVQEIDDQATGMFSIDLKCDSQGRPCITEINVGRFFQITPAFNHSGEFNMAELYIKLALGDTVHVPESSRYSDIGTEETYLIRQPDDEPIVIAASQLAERYRTPAGVET